jgi:hypothetical protein
MTITSENQTQDTQTGHREIVDGRSDMQDVDTHPLLKQDNREKGGTSYTI